MSEQPDHRKPLSPRATVQERMRAAQELSHSGKGAERASITVSERLALVLSLVWLGLVGAFYLVMEPSRGLQNLLSSVMTLVGILLPIAMIWVAAILSRVAREMRAEARELRSSLEAMRRAWASQGMSRTMPAMEKKLDEIAMAARQTESAIATFTSLRSGVATVPSADHKAALVAPRAPAEPEDQPALALGTPAEELRSPVSVADFIRAMNFPDNADDKEGFRALRRGLEDRSISKLIRAAQDLLTLLSQDGIYMDDLRPDRAKPEVWRRFARGERGREVAALGGVRDRSSLALTAGRMRQDAIFRDVAHSFLREFDKTFVEFEKNASDQELADMAETRTARAFMLLGRVTRTFD